MDKKRVKLTSANIDTIEQQTYDRLLGTDNRYAVPEEFRGRQQTAWDDLQQQFPLPERLQSYTTRVTVGRPRYDCFLPPSHTCVCFKCMTHTSTDVSYFHELMEETAINDGVYGVEYPVTCNVAPVYEGITGALDIIRNVAHFYTTYVFVPGVSTFDEPPSTPTFSKVLLRSNDSVDTVARDNQRKHIRRSRMTPTKLFF